LNTCANFAAYSTALLASSEKSVGHIILFNMVESL
jgi:hypothetical protein